MSFYVTFRDFAVLCRILRIQLVSATVHDILTFLLIDIVAKEKENSTSKLSAGETEH